MARRRADPDFDDVPRDETTHEVDDADEGPSRSERKRQDLGLRALGVELVALAPADLDALQLPEKLQDAIVACRKITAHGARLRQEMYIAKVMRGVDVEPIREALERRSEYDRQRVRREHGLEQWRARLLADEADAWTDLARLIDPAALPPLRTLARQARAEQTAGRAPAASRQLFRRLRDLLENAELR